MSGLQISSEKVRELVAKWDRLAGEIWTYGAYTGDALDDAGRLERCAGLRRVVRRLAAAAEERQLDSSPHIDLEGVLLGDPARIPAAIWDAAWAAKRRLEIRAERELQDEPVVPAAAGKTEPVSLEDARDALERMTRLRGGRLPKQREAVRAIGCSKGTVWNAIASSEYLRECRARRPRRKPRITRLTEAAIAEASNRNRLEELLEATESQLADQGRHVQPDPIYAGSDR